MALQPNLRALIIAGRADAPHTLDIFLDYVCPFSAKIARAIDGVLKPLVDDGGAYAGKVKVIFRPQVQPWHASSTFVHEAGIAVARTAPEVFWPFSLALFKDQEKYYDVPTSTQTPVEIRASLAQLAASVLGDAKAREFHGLLELKGSPNGGTSVTDDLKYTIKYSRALGIHVSPTVLLDGIEVKQASSSWGEAEWTDFLKSSVVV